MEEYILKIKRFLGTLLTIGQKLNKGENHDAELIELIDKAHREWQIAINNFNYCVDPDLIDYSIYNIEAAEKKYMCLIKLAQKEKMTANLPVLD